MRPVIITDLKYRMSLAPIRSLHRAGYPVIGADYDNLPLKEILGFCSKDVDHKLLLPFEEERLTAFLSSYCQGQKERPVILPIGRRTLQVLSDHPELKEFADFLVPTNEALELADDKDTVRQTAQALGIPVPPTTSLAEHPSLEAMADTIENYPCFIKYRNGEGLGLRSHERYKIAHNRQELLSYYQEMDAISQNPIVQQYIPGHDVGVAMITDENYDPIDFLCYESLREYPITGGPTCYCYTLFNENLVRYAAKLLKELKFQGIAMLDFRGSPEKPYLLEINPRIWGSANLCDCANASFFESYVKGAMGTAPKLDLDHLTPGYQLGCKMRFTPQSFACLVSHLRHSPKKLSTLGQYAASAMNPTVKDGVFRWKDPRPYVQYLTNFIIKPK